MPKQCTFLLCLTVALFSTLLSGSTGTDQTASPNVLFVIADDLGARLGCYGDDLAVTPNLDRLAQQGVVFRNCFTQFATCGPSRACMLSGLYPYQTGITSNNKTVDQSKTPTTTLPKLFRDNGYFTVRVGKVFHMGIPGGIGEAGLDDAKAWDIAINNTGWDAITGNIDAANHHGERGYGTRIVWAAPDFPNEEMADGAGTVEALRMMNEHHPKKTGKPLMLFMGYYRPHPPMISPKSAWDAIDPGQIKLPHVPEGDRKDIPEINFHLKGDDFNFVPEDVGRSYTHAYHAAINFIDKEVGKLIAGLKKNGLLDNTIIVFTGDQGFHLGEHGHWHKSTFFEEASRVPLIVVDPRKNVKDSNNFDLVGLIDVYPTLCELAGVVATHKLSGQSLAPVLKNRSLPGNQQVLTQGNPGGASIRTERYRYTEWDGGSKGAMLYDLEKDPNEFTNLVNDPAYAAIRKQLKEQLSELMGN
ncbi:MAG: sulfatase [Puniceicoccaceae bacterium]